MNASNNVYSIAGDRTKIGRDVDSWLGRTFARLHDLRAGWMARRARRRELWDLYRLSDRDLWDMGLHRSDIPAIQDGTFRRS